VQLAFRDAPTLRGEPLTSQRSHKPSLREGRASEIDPSNLRVAVIWDYLVTLVKVPKKEAQKGAPPGTTERPERPKRFLLASKTATHPSALALRESSGLEGCHRRTGDASHDSPICPRIATTRSPSALQRPVQAQISQQNWLCAPTDWARHFGRTNKILGVLRLP
jgi:hypothetical protein